VTALLELVGLGRHFAGIAAVDGVNMAVAPGTIHALIGPNGAGKTTLFDLVSGVTAAGSGRIRFDGADITRLPAHRRARRGIARTFQNLRIFGEMAVLENVLTGLHGTLGASVAGILAGSGRARQEEREAVVRARAALAIVGLEARAEARAGALAYGEKRRLEIARAIAAAPRLLLLDEPAAGSNPAETEALAALIRRIREAGTTVLLVEHHMGFVMNLSDRVTVLNFGRPIFDGTPEAARSAPAVIEAYLGARVAARLAQRDVVAS